MRKIIIGLDVGGTEIKAASIDMAGNLLTDLRHFPSQSEKTADVILENMKSIIVSVCSEGDTIQKICFAFPGPFDYDNGISLIHGLDKYDSLYGINLKEYFTEAFGIGSKSIKFCNDVAGFALGEINYGKAGSFEKGMFVCIGTGCGSAFSIDGKLCGGKENHNGTVPHNGYIYDYPFMDGCIDDYISKRGIALLTKEIMGIPLSGKELEAFAESKDAGALRCYSIFGNRLKEALSPFIDKFNPDVLCIGGQITKSGERFLSPLAEKCSVGNCRLYTSDNTSRSTVLGASLL